MEERSERHTFHVKLCKDISEEENQKKKSRNYPEAERSQDRRWLRLCHGRQGTGLSGKRVKHTQGVL